MIESRAGSCFRQSSDYLDLAGFRKSGKARKIRSKCRVCWDVCDRLFPLTSISNYENHSKAKGDTNPFHFIDTKYCSVPELGVRVSC